MSIFAIVVLILTAPIWIIVTCAFISMFLYVAFLVVVYPWIFVLSLLGNKWCQEFLTNM